MSNYVTSVLSQASTLSGAGSSNYLTGVISRSTGLNYLLSFEDEPELLRATSVSQLTSEVGRIFDKQRRPPHTFDRSRFLGKDGRIHTFCSHNWASSRWQKFLAISLHFNLTLGLCITLGISALGFVWHETTGARGWNFVLHVTMTPVMILVTLLLRSWTSRCGLPEPSVFLDVCCIHQTNRDKQRKGIEKLGAFMHSSDHLLVCYSPELYLKRLWTVYEVCTFLAVNHLQRMSVVPLDLPPFALLLSLTGWLTGLVYLILLRYGTPDETSSSMLGNLLLVMTMIIVGIGSVILRARAYFLRLDRMLSDVNSFDIRTAECSCEEDRDYVLDAVIQLMRHVSQERAGEVNRETLLDDFNAHVRSELPKAIRYSTGSIGVPLKHVLILCSVPLTTTVVEDCSFIDTCDPLPVMATRCAAAVSLCFLFVSRACSKHKGLSGPARAAYLAAVIMVATMILVLNLWDWEMGFLLVLTESKTLQELAPFYVWLRAILALLLVIYLSRRGEATKAMATLQLVPEPEPDTFFL